MLVYAERKTEYARRVRAHNRRRAIVVVGLAVLAFAMIVATVHGKAAL